MTGFNRYSIVGTETKKVRSSFVDQDFEISIALPVFHERSPEKRYPVIYLLDSNFFFGMVSEMTRIMAVCYEIPDTLVVGIGYPWREPAADAYDTISGLRCRDYTPVASKRAEREVLDSSPALQHCESGGAEYFLKFIEMELIPSLENKYPIDSSSRTLMGHSWGGTFCLYTLFMTDLFHQYVVCDADTGYGENALFQYAQAYARRQNHLPTRLIFANAGEDGLLTQLQQGEHPGLRITHLATPGLRHCEGAAVHMRAGLSALFA
jgi:predicted alpha/beta superfamily hydrolase